MGLEVHEHISAINLAGELLVAAAEDAGLETAVPSCPGWRVRDLLAHMGGVHRWATSYIECGRPAEATEEEERAYFAAPPDSELLAWSRDGYQGLVAALGSAGAGLGCWTFLPAPTPLAFWARRQAHETSIHAVDAELAAGRAPMPFGAGFAVDGIDELVNGFFARPGRGPRSEVPASLGVVADDVGERRSWVIQYGPEGAVRPGSVQVRHCELVGPASDLYLLLWNRARLDQVSVALPDMSARVKVKGKRDIFDLWQSKARVRWG
ncbi:MAG TPA: maleylpyruvate isomerase family mycothiol-dependent enzyme [Acidimicrobiales bacterium]|nr:maleylpyruvate isomerase family mycothiol-dependent enzyme [Acidimicrobiales bacterium]